MDIAGVALSPENGRLRFLASRNRRSTRRRRRIAMGSAYNPASAESPTGMASVSSRLSSDDPVAMRLHESARRMAAIAVFSGVVNVLTLSGSLYMLQVYD